MFMGILQLTFTVFDHSTPGWPVKTVTLVEAGFDMSESFKGAYLPPVRVRRTYLLTIPNLILHTALMAYAPASSRKSQRT